MRRGIRSQRHFTPQAAGNTARRDSTDEIHIENIPDGQEIEAIRLPWKSILCAKPLRRTPEKQKFG